MKRKKLWLFPAVLALALLCAACATNAAAPQNEPSGEEDVAEFAAETADEVTQETSEADSQEGDTIMSDGLTLTGEWDKVFPQSDKVNHRKVTFHNRYGITLAADLYEPKCAARSARSRNRFPGCTRRLWRNAAS